MATTASARRSGQVRRKAAATPQQADKRRYIIQHAATLFSEVGYWAATMDDLSDRTGLNKGTLYYYYGAKSDLLYEIVSITHQAMHDCIDAARANPDPVLALSDFIDRMVDWVGQHREYAVILSKEQDYFTDTLPADQVENAKNTHRNYMRKLYGLVSAGIEAGVFRNCEVRVVGRAISTLLFYSPNWRLASMGPAAISTQLKQLVLDGVKA